MSAQPSLFRRLSRSFAPLASFTGVRSSVRGKLLRVVLITTVMTLCVAGGFMLSADINRYKQSWTADLGTEASILAVSLAPAMAFDDHDAAVRDLSALKVRPRVMAVAAYSADGSLYASFVRSSGESLPAHAPPPGVVTAGERVEFARAIERDGEQLGTIYLRARYDTLGRVEDYLVIFVLVTVLSMVVAIFLSRRLQHGILRPLDAMAVIANAIVKRRDYSLRAQKTSDDEIGVVVDAFNNMLDEVEASAKGLREADRRKDEFLATLAHELRNPLAPIRHAARMLESRAIDESQQKWARDVISRQVRRMALLLDDLLDVSRITQGRLELKIEIVSLQSIVDAAVELARPLIEAKQHQLSIELPPAPLLLNVDPLRMSQSLANLLTNSAKYTDARGRITVRARLLEQQLVLSVTDNGIGFAPDTAINLFEMFSQASVAVARSEGGLGIGLALVKGLITLHGGTIEAHSPGLGQGSEFAIRLPRAVVSAAAPEPAGEPSAVPPDPTASCRIVVVDDNRDAADSLAMLLESQGYQVTVGYNGAQALRIIGAAAPQVAILDIGMPDMTGYQVATRIRAEPWGQNICLIAMTGWGQADDKARARAAGFDHHLTKPVDPEEVERLLRAVFAAPHVRAGSPP
jgi:signal transduction histidine kinase/CheY-like chemotaxis protein